MAEDTPATDAGNPAPRSQPGRKALRHKETTSRSGPPPKKSKTDIAIEQAAARLAAAAPPLSEGQKRRIAELFAPAISIVVQR